MIALDASTLIAYLDRNDALHERARDALLSNAADDLCASVITVADVLVGPARRGAAPQVRQTLVELGVSPVELRAGDELLLAALRARTGLKMPDCCVLLSARAVNAAILSFDERLLKAAQSEAIAIAARA